MKTSAKFFGLTVGP